MANKKKKSKRGEPDLFSAAKSHRIAKPKEWKFPGGVRFADVKPGDIFVFTKARDWERDGEILEMRGEVVDKGVLDAKTRYFTVKIIHPENEALEEADIRRFILPKK